MAQFGVHPIIQRATEDFQFGNGDASPAIQTVMHPVFLRGIYRGLLDMASVPDDCTMLMPKNTLTTWKVELCVGSVYLRIAKLKLIIPSVEQFVPIVNVFDVADEEFKEQCRLMPDVVTLNNRHT